MTSHKVFLQSNGELMIFANFEKCCYANFLSPIVDCVSFKLKLKFEKDKYYKNHVNVGQMYPFYDKYILNNTFENYDVVWPGVCHIFMLIQFLKKKCD